MVFRGTLGNVQSKDLKNCPRNSSEAKSSEDSFWGPRTGHSPGSRGKPWDLFIIPWLCRFTTFYYWFPMSPNSENVGHWEDCFSMSPTFCEKRGTLVVLFFNVPHFLTPMSHVLWNYPGKCPVLLLRVKPAKPGNNEVCYSKRPYLNDVYTIFGILDPLPPCLHFSHIHSSKSTQPPLISLHLGTPPPSPCQRHLSVFNFT